MNDPRCRGKHFSFRLLKTEVDFGCARVVRSGAPARGARSTDVCSCPGKSLLEIMSNRRGVKRDREEEVSNDGVESSHSPSDSSSSQKRGKFERSFVTSWLDRFEWLLFDRERNLMFCSLCTKYRKNNAFTEGCQNFRRDNLNKHIATNDHKFCVEQNCALGKPPTTVPRDEPSPIVQHLTSERASSPITPGGRHSSSDSSRSSGVFSSASSSLPQSPASLPLPSPPAFAPSKTPTSTLHAPVPLLPYHPSLLPAGYMPDPRLHLYHGNYQTLVWQIWLDWNIRSNLLWKKLAKLCNDKTLLLLSAGEPGCGEGKPKDNLPITPNYLANPPFPYLSGSSNFRQAESHASLPSSQSSSHKQASRTPLTNDTHTRNGTSSTPLQDENGKYWAWLCKFRKNSFSLQSR